MQSPRLESDWLMAQPSRRALLPPSAAAAAENPPTAIGSWRSLPARSTRQMLVVDGGPPLIPGELIAIWTTVCARELCWLLWVERTVRASFPIVSNCGATHDSRLNATPKWFSWV